MTKFKIGDDVWFFYTNFGRNCWGEDDTIIYPEKIELLNGKIVDVNERKDCVYIYVKGCTNILQIGWTFFEDWVFASAQLAKEGMLQHVKKLEIEE